ncbi:MAG: thioesterase family protein [Gammaproteobacteria bacterium]|jgi:acyl-CoA thioester hydrolase|nr:thioesterase family protein [Gammaproteobacteria bacterium]
MTSPIRTLDTTVIKDWIDYNGHLNEAYYLVIFSQATDATQHHMGMTLESIKTTGYTLFTVATQLRYLQEIGLGKAVYVTTQLLQHDSKRLRIFHTMYNAQNEPLATAEKLFLSYNLQQKKVVDFHHDFASKLTQWQQQQGDMPVPTAAGRGISLTRK